MKKKLKERFLPSTYTLDLYNQMAALKQESRSVTEYIHEFEKIMMKLDVEEREEQTIARFMGGLDRSIVKKLELQNYTTLDELFQLAVKVEKHQKEKKKIKGSFQYSKGNTSYLPKAKKGEVSKDKGKGVVQGAEKKDKSHLKCFKCQGYGHYKSECPNQKAMTLIDIEAINAALEQETGQESGYLVETEGEEGQKKQF